MNKTHNNEWWKEVFDERYLTTYCDIIPPERTEQEISFLLAHLNLKEGAKILDVACGHGRHAIELARHGYAVTGLDFSQHFIDLARHSAHDTDIQFIHGDMREMPFVEAFDAAVNMFTSFGYFENEDDHALALRNISRALKPGGIFLIDLNNTVNLLRRMSREGVVDEQVGTLIHTDTHTLSNGRVVTTEHTIDPAAMRWSMTRTWKEGDSTQRYTTNIRLFSLPELTHMLSAQGLRIEQVWGDFHGSSFGFDSPRMILRAKKDSG